MGEVCLEKNLGIPAAIVSSRAMRWGRASVGCSMDFCRRALPYEAEYGIFEFVPHVSGATVGETVHLFSQCTVTQLRTCTGASQILAVAGRPCSCRRCCCCVSRCGGLCFSFGCLLLVQVRYPLHRSP